MRTRWRRGACAATLALWLLPASSWAADPCPTGTNVIVGSGGSAHDTLIQKAATAFVAANHDLTVVYEDPGACTGLGNLLGGTAISKNPAQSWKWDAGTSAVVQVACAPAGNLPTFAAMGNSAEQCSGLPTLASKGVSVFTGPVVAVDFIVPRDPSNNQQSISAEAAYFVYGFGSEAKAAPWTTDKSIIRRNESSFVTIFVSLATGLPLTLKGEDAKTNQGTVDLVAAGGNGVVDLAGALGYASNDIVDVSTNRAKVRILAYQHKGQSCGYWPDSGPDAFDKANVRNGQYYLWSTVHFFAPATGGVVTDPATKKLIDFIVSPPNDGALQAQVDANNVPQCAMHVARDTDLGPLMSYQPAEPCGCFFENAVAKHTSCTACTDSTSCPTSAPVCRHNFCEVK